MGTAQIASLVFIVKEQDILLAMKKRGFGVGRWNGVGGKAEENEATREAAIRECQEEIGVTPNSLIEVALLDFNFPAGKQGWKVHVYLCKSWVGEPVETEEMKPKWFKKTEIPYDEMWDDDKYWLPEVLNGNYVSASFYFDDKDKVLKHQLTIKGN